MIVILTQTINNIFYWFNLTNCPCYQSFRVVMDDKVGSYFEQTSCSFDYTKIFTITNFNKWNDLFEAVY